MRYIITALALFLVGFQMYTAGIEPLSAIYQRTVHLTLILVLLFLTIPCSTRLPALVRWPIDILFVSAALAAGGYLYLNYNEIVDRIGWYEPADIWL
ncbi:MAG: TRAP transporter permease, partial [Pseudomonadota bacterium]